MTKFSDEVPVSLGELDERLKAILRIKIREFVHLNPVFNCIPSIDVASYGSGQTRLNAVENLTITSRSQFRQEIFSRFNEIQMPGQGAAENDVLSGRPLHTGLPRNFFSGYDQECPYKVRVIPLRRRYVRRSSV
jgi:hypothetical protein